MPSIVPRTLRLLAVLAAVVLLSSNSIAATSAPGYNLRWDQCYADGGAWNKNFACDTNTGTDRLVVSFELASPITDMSGIELAMDLGSSSASLPAWWQFKSAGTCRQTSLGFSVTPPAGANQCIDWSAGQAQGGIGAYNIGFSGPNTARLTAAMAVPPAALASLTPGTEFFACSVNINHAKTVGTGACTGCTTPVCIFVSLLKLTTSVAANDVNLTRGANFIGSSYATWQNGYPTDVTKSCQGFPGVPSNPNCIPATTHFTCVLATPTSSRNSTWGAVKSLYR